MGINTGIKLYIYLDKEGEEISHISYEFEEEFAVNEYFVYLVYVRLYYGTEILLEPVGGGDIVFECSYFDYAYTHGGMVWKAARYQIEDIRKKIDWKTINKELEKN